jgi:hypothetical protein
MRLLKLLCLVLLLSAFAAAQVTIIQGTASNWAPGAYAGPFVPLVSTPSVTLSTVSPGAVGASNATFGNVAGATNATLSNEFIAPPPTGVNTVPVFYGAISPAPAEAPSGVTGIFNFGIASRGPGVAQLMAEAGPAKKAVRTVTNQDIDRMNESTGTVKYDHKTEKL